jgi:hypothetical protein
MKSLKNGGSGRKIKKTFRLFIEKIITNRKKKTYLSQFDPQ